MAVVRDTVSYQTDYIATAAFFCGVLCIALMLRFRGFKANFNLSSGKRVKSEYYEDIPVTSATNGAYRTNREEFYGNGSLSDPPKRLDPSMVKLPPSSRPATVQLPAAAKPPATIPSGLQPSKSTSNLNQAANKYVQVPVDLAKSTPDVSTHPGAEPPASNQSKNLNKNLNKNKANQTKESKKQEQEQKKLEKKRLDDEKKRLNEQKKREKLAAQEQAKLEKERKAREKQEAQQQAKLAKEQNKKDKAKPVAKPRLNPLAQGVGPANPVNANTSRNAPPAAAPQASSLYATNTLESSISRTSGPPAYAEVGPPPPPLPNQNDNTGNTSFGRRIDEPSTWDIVSQHRQAVTRPPVTGGNPAMKQTVLDLEYTKETARKSIYL